MLLLLLACPTTQTVDTGDTEAQDTALPSSEVYEGNAPCRPAVEGLVLEVHDGDTATIQINGINETVRFVGIDTPEMDWSGSNPDCWAEEATYRSTQLIEGRTVWVGFDAVCEDDYDRTLAYITLDGEFINRLLVREGHAWAFPFEPNTTFASSLQTAEQQASAEGAGLWSNCNY